MFEKKEDQLFDFAFGELSDQEAQLLEAELLKNVPSQAEVDFLRTLKSDLTSLRDIPEMQFSKERLRAAILEQGLKPKKPVSNWLNWVLAPTAMAGVLALGFILMNGTSHKEPTFVPGPNVAALQSKESSFSGLKKPEFSSIPTVTNSDSAKSDAGDGFPDVAGVHYAFVASNKAPVRRHVSKHTIPVRVHGDVEGPELVATNFDSGGSMRKALDNPTPSFTATMAVTREPELHNDAASIAFSKKDGRKVDVKFIEINKDQDSGIGAAVATEVSSTSDVVIGG